MSTQPEFFLAEMGQIFKNGKLTKEKTFQMERPPKSYFFVGLEDGRVYFSWLWGCFRER
jgi:hypothetical protein